MRSRVGRALASAPSPWRPISALAFVGLALIAFFGLGLDRYLRPDALREYDALLRSWAELKGPVIVLTFMAAYVAIALACLPAVAFMSVLAGYLLGPVAGVATAYSSAMVAAVLTYLGARFAFRATVIRRGGKMLLRLEEAFERNAVVMLVFMRFLPIIPFWTANAVPAVLGIRFGAFIIATAIGILPGSVLLPNLGHGIHEVLTAGDDYELSLLSNPRILIPVAVGSVLTLAALVWRAVTTRRKRVASNHN